MEQWQKDNDKLTGDAKARHLKEKPAPVASAQRASEVRWSTLFESMMYWRKRLFAFKGFLHEMHQKSDELCTTASMLYDLSRSQVYQGVKLQLAFVSQHMQFIYDMVAGLQKQLGGGGGQDLLAFLQDIKDRMATLRSGTFDGVVKKLLSKLPSAQARVQQACLQDDAAAMGAKVDSLHTHTIRGHADTQRALECFNPEVLQTPGMLPYSSISRHIPGVPKAEWEKYVALPAPQPKPSNTTERASWWRHRLTDFPTLSSIALFFVTRPRSACYAERVFSLIGHILSKNRLHMGNDTLRHLAIMYVNKDDILDQPITIREDDDLERDE